MVENESSAVSRFAHYYLRALRAPALLVACLAGSVLLTAFMTWPMLLGVYLEHGAAALNVFASDAEAPKIYWYAMVAWWGLGIPGLWAALKTGSKSNE